MHHFFVRQENIFETEIRIDDAGDLNHAVRVLRLEKGEHILVSGPDGTDYLCAVEGMQEDAYLKLRIEEVQTDNHELPARVILFVCMTKAERMELTIQKAVELGVSEIVPVSSKNCIVRLDAKKTESRVKRWQAIADNAAMQSKRSILPRVHAPVDFREAVTLCEACDVSLIPYEEERGMAATCEAIIRFLPQTSIGVIIGPEGGFDPMEVSMAKRHGITPISLGKRILRAETAAIAILSLIMIRLEIAAEMDFDEA